MGIYDESRISALPVLVKNTWIIAVPSWRPSQKVPDYIRI
jgi:hypothetical protein